MPHAANSKHQKAPLSNRIADDASKKRCRDGNNERRCLQRKKPRTARAPTSHPTPSTSHATNATLDEEQQGTTPNLLRRKRHPPTSSPVKSTNTTDINSETPVELLVHGREKRSTAGKASSTRRLDDRLDWIFGEDEDDSDFVDDTEDGPAEDMNMDMDIIVGVEDDTMKTAGRKANWRKGQDEQPEPSKRPAKKSGVLKNTGLSLEQIKSRSRDATSQAAEYLVDRLVQYRLSRTGHEEVLVRWLGFPKPRDHTWEEVEHFRQDCGLDVIELLKSFLPSARLEYFEMTNRKRLTNTAKTSRRSLP